MIGMNNEEKHAAKLLRDAGFLVFWQEYGAGRGYWATHPRLLSQYDLRTCAQKALNDLKKLEEEV